MKIALSPYHLTTRELPAMTALQLASSVITFMPGVMAGVGSHAGRFERLARGSHRYSRVVESWGWSTPLWEAGVIESGLPDDDASTDMRVAWERCTRDDRYAPLRPFLKGHLLEDQSRWIEAAAADVLKGGPDPAITVPLTAGLDRFAARNRLAVVRPKPTSIAQHAEAALATPIASVVLPVLVQASAERILLMRDTLRVELGDLRHALADASVGRESSLRTAARAYAESFAAAEPELHADQARDEVRVIAAPISLAIVRLPADAVLRSSCSAACGALGAPPPAHAPGLAQPDPFDRADLISFVVGKVGASATAAPRLSPGRR